MAGPHVEVGTGRAHVEVELTPRGRTLWREMNLSYRRAVNERFAGRLTDDQVAALVEITVTLGGCTPPT